MASAHAQAKYDARRALHDAMHVDCTHTPEGGGASTGLTVRWHNKIARHGDLENTGYAEIIEGIDRMIFDLEELAAKGLTLGRGDSIQLEALMGGAVFQLDSQEPDTGPIERIWLVTRSA